MKMKRFLCAVLVAFSLFAFAPEKSIDVKALTSAELQQKINEFNAI